jgi:hypothetical protein
VLSLGHSYGVTENTAGIAILSICHSYGVMEPRRGIVVLSIGHSYGVHQNNYVEGILVSTFEDALAFRILL